MSLPTASTDLDAGVAGANWPVQLGGRGYMVDFSRNATFTERSIPLLRNQADTGGNWSEASLNPEDLIRRSVESCHGGAGQKYRDLPDSDRNRFRRSRGVDVFSQQGEIKLLLIPTEPADCGATSVAGTPYPFSGNRLLNAGNWMHVINGAQGVRYSSNGGTTWAGITGLPAQDITCWATDGWQILTGHENGAVYAFTYGGSAAYSLFTGATAVSAIGYVKGRWLVADFNGKLWNPTDFTTPPNVLPTELIDFKASETGRWVTHFAEGNGHIYMGVAGTRGGIVFKTAVKPDGTALDVPVQALKLPDGEDIVGLYGYLGFIFIATKTASDIGVRMAEAAGDGTLNVGSRIILTDVNIQSSVPMIGYDRYVYCGANNLQRIEYFGIETARTGLVALDLSYFTRPLTPSYSEHVSVSGGSSCYGVALFGATLCFTVENSGANTDFYKLSGTDMMSSGEISFGKLNFGVADQKTAMKLDLVFDASASATVTPWVTVDGTTTTFSALTTANEPAATVSIDALSGREFEVGLTLARGATTTSNVTVKRATLRAFAAASRTNEYILPLVLARRVQDLNGREVLLDTAAELAAVKAMLGTVVVLKVGTRTTYVQVRDYQFDIGAMDQTSGMLQGVLSVKVQEVA